jgi:hypothetical protein
VPPALNRPLHLQLVRNLLAGVGRPELENTPLLRTDAFGSLVRLVFLWPKPVDGPELRQLLRLEWLVLALQIAVDFAVCSDEFLGGPLPPLAGPTIDGVKTLEQLVAFCRSVFSKQLNLSTMPPPTRTVSAAVLSGSPLVQRMRQHAMPFLRCAALFVRTFSVLHFGAGAALPAASESYEELLAYLGLPPLEATVAELSSSQAWVVLAWLRQLPPSQTPEDARLSAPALPFRLVELPALYTDIVSQYMTASCSLCESATNQNALCLLCGQVVCSDACVGSHAEEHADVGMYLVVHTTGVLLLRGDRVCNWGSPYLDEHGEEDIELRRGKPLHLNAARYAQLRRLWVTQGIEHDSHVLKNSSLQSGHDFLEG